MEQQILEGETPDPVARPAGCRFHPRCPVVASGEAARLGILDRCTGVDPALTAVAADRTVACHLGPRVGDAE
jgi:ABC-type dipeptide/oligopeptide/nickel transport system ATPase component